MKNLNKSVAGKIKVENKFSKMKMMLEHDARIPDDDTDLIPELENMLLRQVMEFEKQSASPVYIRLYDKLDKPTRFKPVNEIPEDDIEQSWIDLLNYLRAYNVDLSVCSPNVSARELYRFTTEELFQQKIADSNTPGMTNCFIYDEFYPDPVYDNTRAIQEDLLPGIFSTQHNLFNFWFATQRITLNGKKYENFDKLKQRIDAFKTCFNNMKLKKVNTFSCVVNRTNTLAEGDYQFSASLGSLETFYKGKWKVKFLRDDLGYWVIKNIWLEGIDL
jgi:hypothetical protein